MSRLSGPDFDPKKITPKTYVRDHVLIRIVLRAAAEAEVTGNLGTANALKEIMASIFKEVQTPQILKDKYRELFEAYRTHFQYKRDGVLPGKDSPEEDIPF